MGDIVVGVLLALLAIVCCSLMRDVFRKDKSAETLKVDTGTKQFHFVYPYRGRMRRLVVIADDAIEAEERVRAMVDARLVVEGADVD